MNLRTGLAFMAAAGLLAATSATAQTTPTPSPDSKQVIPEKQGDAVQSGRSESLSNKLGRTGGVITPSTNVDPGMAAPAPDPSPHSTPVIPPAATGGDTAR